MSKKPEKITCPECLGKKFRITLRRNASLFGSFVDEKCPVCKGKGFLIK